MPEQDILFLVALQPIDVKAKAMATVKIFGDKLTQSFRTARR